MAVLRILEFILYKSTFFFFFFKRGERHGATCFVLKIKVSRCQGKAMVKGKMLEVGREVTHFMMKHGRWKKMKLVCNSSKGEIIEMLVNIAVFHNWLVKGIIKRCGSESGPFIKISLSLFCIKSEYTFVFYKISTHLYLKKLLSIFYSPWNYFSGDYC